MTFFNSVPGQIAALADNDGVVGLPVVVDGIQGSWFPSFKSILTGVQVGLDTNAQFLHTLSNIIYVYSFGDRISQLQITGLSAIADCNFGALSGLEQVIGYYQQNRIAVRSTPIQVALGVSPAGRFTGFLTSMHADLINPEFSVAPFQMQFTIFPGGN